MTDFFNRQIIETEDGSSSIKLGDFDEQFHSIHGAISESEHIFIRSGLAQFPADARLNILEIGFGTGLNALLTLHHRSGRRISYHTVEAYPLDYQEVSALNYVDKIDESLRAAFLRMHAAGDGEIVELASGFSFQKRLCRLQDADFQADTYDLVYFDAFSPNTQPELWSASIFAKMWLSMRVGGILVTYCAKGSVKRAFRSVGFVVEGLPGPVGKREITRCVKI